MTRDPHAKLRKVLSLIKHIATQPRTLTEIALHLEVSERSAYRYIILLQEVGEPIYKDGKLWSKL